MSNEVEAESVDEVLEIEAEGVSPAVFLDELKSRCSAANIEIQTQSFDDDPTIYTFISLPAGRGKRWISATGGRLEGLLAVNFEKFVFLQGFEAICCYSEGFIEAGLRGVPLSPMLAMRRVMLSAGQMGDESEIVLQPSAGVENRPTYRVGLASPEFAALAQLPTPARRYTLQLSGIDLKTHDQAVSSLSKYGNSFLFQMDLLYNASFMLERGRVRRFRPSRRKGEAISLQYPTAEYDDAPVSLYWYARSARGMPLLQFLAFYQCIEFYFPTFSQAEARRKIALLLKDPAFRADRDSDVARLLSSILVSRSGGIGDERAQLRATIHECLSAEEVRTFFNEDDERNAFFNAKPKSGIHKIPVANENVDLRNDVADRIYNIRCRIVHTKDGENRSGSMILPFSEEADVLIYDIELAQFIARKVQSRQVLC